MADDRTRARRDKFRRDLLRILGEDVPDPSTTEASPVKRASAKKRASRTRRKPPDGATVPDM